jgi:NAD(P)-dependent dehydrogenase (short-subunit alcohol dehydrogenase family)
MEANMSAPVTLITGTSTGLGQTTALHLARKGHRVFATMRAPERGAGPLLDAAKNEGLQITVSALDVCDAKSIQQAVAAVLKDAGQIDVLINNAGRGDLGAVELATDEQVRGMFETNVYGPIRMCQAVLPSMRARGSGTIVNISSVAGLIVGAGNGLYAGTKHALEALSEALALEVLQYGIRVAIIEPGFFDTPIIDKAAASVTAAGDTPYANVEGRMAGIYMGGKAAAQNPQEVAEIIEHAITTDQPRLRYLVGVDATVFTTERPKMSDEEYLQSFGRIQTDEEFFAEFMRRFPMPA